MNPPFGSCEISINSFITLFPALSLMWSLFFPISSGTTG
jgi:hypothetical protein